MSHSDAEEDLGCTMVYPCSRCDKAKPRRDFHKMYDRVNMTELFCKTCKECREKAKATKESKKEQKTNQQQNLTTTMHKIKPLIP